MIAPCSVNEAVVGFRGHLQAEQHVLRRQQRQADQQRENAAEQECASIADQIHDADALVIDASAPSS